MVNFFFFFKTQFGKPPWSQLLKQWITIITHRINRYTVDSIVHVCFVNTYPLVNELSGGWHYLLFPFEQLGPVIFKSNDQTSPALRVSIEWLHLLLTIEETCFSLSYCTLTIKLAFIAPLLYTLHMTDFPLT